MNRGQKKTVRLFQMVKYCKFPMGSIELDAGDRKEVIPEIRWAM
jgi:hypothetical protein